VTEREVYHTGKRVITPGRELSHREEESLTDGQRPLSLTDGQSLSLTYGQQ